MGVQDRQARKICRFPRPVRLPEAVFIRPPADGGDRLLACCSDPEAHPTASARQERKTAAAKGVGPAGRVLAFEPAPAARGQLLQNLALSRFPWVEVSSQALADCAGERDFVAFSNDAWGSSSFAPPSEFAGGSVETVETTT